MPKTEAPLRVVLLDIDGPCLKDTFSPVMRSMTLNFGHEYTAEIERNVFSQNREQAAAFVIKKIGLHMSQKELIRLYFEERAKFEERNPPDAVEGLAEFLEMLKGLDLQVICYGGLEHSYFESRLSNLAHYFENYVCTNDFRPGLKEMMRDYPELKPHQFLVIDDVNAVAQEAKRLGMQFIGVPAAFAWSHQRREMIAGGVQHLFRSVADIPPTLIAQLAAVTA